MNSKREDSSSTSPEDNLYLDPNNLDVKKKYVALNVDVDGSKNRKLSDGKM